MRKRVSSLQTFLTKTIFPTIWISLFGMGALTMFPGNAAASDASAKWMFLLAWLCGTTFIYWAIEASSKALNYD